MPPLTRATLLELADRFAGRDQTEVHIRVTDLVQFPDEEPFRTTVARVELRRVPGQPWFLQYVSHPSESMGLTAGVHPLMEDYTAYVRARHELKLPPARFVHCAQELEEDGCRPCGALNLNPTDGTPLVATWRALRALELAQAHFEVNTYGPAGRPCRHCGQPA